MVSLYKYFYFGHSLESVLPKVNLAEEAKEDD